MTIVDIDETDTPSHYRSIRTASMQFIFPVGCRIEWTFDVC